MAEDTNTTEPVRRRLRLGIVGIGVGASEILPQMEAMSDIQLVAAADINRRVLNTFQHRYGAKAYDSIEKLCADPNVEAVWISTPNRFHAPHTIMAAEHGKHVVVEKPMAISLAEAEKMIEAVEKNKVKLLCGHTQSYGPHIRTMRKIIQSGELGRLCALHVWAYTDWMLRPRTAEELDINQGGGVPYRQGPHQIDTLRLLGGGNGAQRARDRGTMVPRPADPRLLLRVHGVRGRHTGNAHAQRLRLFSRVRIGALGQAKQPLPRSRAGGDSQIAIGRYSQRKRRQGRNAYRWLARKRHPRPKQTQAVASQRSRNLNRDL